MAHYGLKNLAHDRGLACKKNMQITEQNILARLKNPAPPPPGSLMVAP